LFWSFVILSDSEVHCARRITAELQRQRTFAVRDVNEWC
jgi:hypothetical protein